MATYPKIVRTAGARTTTVTDLVKATISSKALIAPTGQLITQDQVKDPGQLVQLLNGIQGEVQRVTQGGNANPMTTPSIVRNVSVTNGAVVIIRHALGRPYSDWWVTRQRSSSAEFYELASTDPSYPSGLDASRALVLISNCVGLFDFAICG